MRRLDATIIQPNWRATDWHGHSTLSTLCPGHRHHSSSHGVSQCGLEPLFKILGALLCRDVGRQGGYSECGRWSRRTHALTGGPPYTPAHPPTRKAAVVRNLLAYLLRALRVAAMRHKSKHHQIHGKPQWDANSLQVR